MCTEHHGPINNSIGKSYVGVQLVRLLLANAEQFASYMGEGDKFLPILCVCYTNHALDQFLEDLWDAGIKDIVRVGGRSKSELMQKLNVRDVAKLSQTKRQSGMLFGLYKKLEEIQLRLEECSAILTKAHLGWEDIQDLLELQVSVNIGSPVIPELLVGLRSLCRV